MERKRSATCEARVSNFGFVASAYSWVQPAALCAAPFSDRSGCVRKPQFPRCHVTRSTSGEPRILRMNSLMEMGMKTTPENQCRQTSARPERDGVRNRPTLDAIAYVPSVDIIKSSNKKTTYFKSIVLASLPGTKKEEMKTASMTELRSPLYSGALALLICEWAAKDSDRYPHRTFRTENMGSSSVRWIRSGVGNGWRDRTRPRVRPGWKWGTFGSENMREGWK